MARAAALIALLVLVLGTVGCGDDSQADGDSDGSGKSGAKALKSDYDPKPFSNKMKARIQVHDFYAYMGYYNAPYLCDEFTDQARKQIASGALGVVPPNGKRTCEAVFETMFDRSRRNGDPLKRGMMIEVEKVEVDGQRAVATIDFGGAQSGRVPAVKRNGRWELTTDFILPNEPLTGN